MVLYGFGRSSKHKELQESTMVNSFALQYTSSTSPDWHPSSKRRDGALVAHALFDASNFQQSAGF
jgi:hypothetical protein